MILRRKLDQYMHEKDEFVCKTSKVNVNHLSYKTKSTLKATKEGTKSRIINSLLTWLVRSAWEKFVFGFCIYYACASRYLAVM